jgi:hypothetical protein
VLIQYNLAPWRALHVAGAEPQRLRHSRQAVFEIEFTRDPVRHAALLSQNARARAKRKNEGRRERERGESGDENAN